MSLHKLIFRLTAIIPLLAIQPVLAFDLFSSSPVVGRMGAIEIKANEIADLINAQPPEVRAAFKANPETLKSLVQAELLRRAVLTEAKLAEWDKRPEVALTMERARDQVIIDHYLDTRSRPDTAWPSAQEVQTAYENNKSQFPLPAQIRLAQILIRLPEKPSAEETRRASALVRELDIKLEKGADFAALARLHSQDETSKEKGGDHPDWLNETELTPQIRDGLSGVKTGGFSKPVRTPFGWQIFKVQDRKSSAFQPLESVRELIVKSMREARAKENRHKVIEGLNKQNPPVLDDKAIAGIK